MSRRIKQLKAKFKKKLSSRSFDLFLKAAMDELPSLTPLEARGDRPLQMTFEDMLKALVFFHLEEHKSASHLLQVLDEDNFARKSIAPSKGIKKSSFSEAINSRGLEQFFQLFEVLQSKATKGIPKEYENLGDLVAIDGSYIDACLSMDWADYSGSSKKAKVHFGFDLNRSIPRKIYLTDGKKSEHPFVSQILEPGQTGVLDRGYVCYKNFDTWQEEGKHFVCRIQERSTKTEIRSNELKPNSIVFYDSIVRLGTKGTNQVEKELRVVGFRADGKNFWIATDRHDLTAEEVAMIYKLRWKIETFFGWWKRHLKVYHLLARSPYGLMVQILSGLITYLLLAIHCQEEHGEKVSIKRVRELRAKINNEGVAPAKQRVRINRPRKPKRPKRGAST